jgi:hypothetical protein
LGGQAVAPPFTAWALLCNAKAIENLSAKAAKLWRKPQQPAALRESLEDAGGFAPKNSSALPPLCKNYSIIAYEALLHIVFYTFRLFSDCSGSGGGGC